MTVQPKMTAPDSQTPAVRELSGEIDRISAALLGADSYLRSLQVDDGHWCGELEGDTILESEYALMLYFLGRQEDVRFRQLALHLRSQQLEDGGWANYPGGLAEVSTCRWCATRLIESTIFESPFLSIFTSRWFSRAVRKAV